MSRFIPEIFFLVNLGTIAHEKSAKRASSPGDDRESMRKGHLPNSLERKKDNQASLSISPSLLPLSFRLFCRSYVERERERERARSGLGVGDRFHGVESETSARNISFYMLGMFVHRPLCMLQFRAGSHFFAISHFRLGGRPFAMHVFMYCHDHNRLQRCCVPKLNAVFAPSVNHI